MIKGQKCSAATKHKMSISRTGTKHWNWKGGFSVSPSGYILIKTEKRKYRLQHRVIMENHIGRKLQNFELVHHKNGNKLDNRIGNLEILNWSNHQKYHNNLKEWNATRTRNSVMGKTIICAKCKRNKALHSVKYHLCRPCYRRIYLNNH